MKKSNLIKGIVCGLMLTAVVGTSGFAASRALTNVNSGDYVYEVEFYQNNKYGTYGKFTAYGEVDSAETRVVNTSSAPRKYYLETYERNAYLGTITSSDYSVPILTPGGNDYAYIVRYYDNPLYDYYHYGKSYYSTQSTSVVIDNYECIVRQYR